MNHDWRLFGSWKTDKILYFVCFVLAFFCLLAVALAAERYNLSKPTHAAAAVVGTGFLVWRVIFSSSGSWLFDGITTLYLLPAFVLAVMAISHLHDPGNAAIWVFNKRGWGGAGFGLFIAFTVVGAFTLTLWTADSLFRFGVPGSFYGDCWFLAFSFLWPWVALSRVPATSTGQDAETDPSDMRFFPVYLLVPLTLLYLAMVLIYIVNIVILLELPRGEIGSFIGWLAVLVVATHMIALPLAGTAGCLVEFYCDHAYRLLLAPIAVLALAVWIRIDTHGLTEQRYFLIVMTIWLAAMAAYFVIRPGGRIVIVPATLSVMLFLGGFGPWGAEDLSTWSQLGRLSSPLTKSVLDEACLV